MYGYGPQFSGGKEFFANPIIGCKDIKQKPSQFFWTLCTQPDKGIATLCIDNGIILIVII